MKKFNEMIEQLKKCRGVGVIDWHIKTSITKNVKYKKWGKTYQKIVEVISKDESIWRIIKPYDLANYFIKRFN